MEDRRNVGESSCNFGDGTDQNFQSLMFMMMMMMMMLMMMMMMKFNVAHVLSYWTVGYSFGIRAGQKKAHSM